MRTLLFYLAFLPAMSGHAVPQVNFISALNRPATTLSEHNDSQSGSSTLGNFWQPKTWLPNIFSLSLLGVSLYYGYQWWSKKRRALHASPPSNHPIKVTTLPTTSTSQADIEANMIAVLTNHGVDTSTNYITHIDTVSSDQAEDVFNVFTPVNIHHDYYRIHINRLRGTCVCTPQHLQIIDQSHSQ